MDNQIQNVEHLADFRIKASLGVILIAIFILAPFSINYFLHGHHVPGMLLMFIVFLSSVNAWNCYHRQCYSPLTFLFMVPAIIICLLITFREQGTVITYWCYPAVLFFYFMLSERQAWISNILLLGIIFFQAWSILDQEFMIRFVVTLFCVSVLSAVLVRIITAQQEQSKLNTMFDPLTGLFNQMMLNNISEQIIQQNHRSGIPLTLAVLDIDDFKTINDNLGHNKGDKILRGIGEFLHKRIYRRADMVFYIGGNKFLVILYNTDIGNGRQVAEELRSDIASLDLIPGHPVTVSIGVTTLISSDDHESWMKRCDENLYKAKEGGRNMVVS